LAKGLKPIFNKYINETSINTNDLNNLGFEAEKQKAILNLIDTKIDDDMDKVIAELKKMEDMSNNKFNRY
jgi:hypothetical protein